MWDPSNREPAGERPSALGRCFRGSGCQPYTRGVGIPSPWGRTEDCRPGGCTNMKMGEDWIGSNMSMKIYPIGWGGGRI